MPAQRTALIDYVELIVDGAALGPERLHLKHLEIDLSTALPAMAVMEFHDPEVAITDSNLFSVGKTLEIKFKRRGDTSAATSVFNGEIAGVQPEFNYQDNHLTVVAYDKSHRMTRGTKSRTFLQQTDKDIISTIVGEYGLSVSGTATTITYEYLCQDNISDYDFVQRLVHRNGMMMMMMDGTALKFQPPSTATAQITLHYGGNVTYFRPRLNTAEQVTKTLTRGWDPKTKAAVTGTVNSGQLASPGSLGSGAAAVARFNSPIETIITGDIRTSDTATLFGKAHFFQNQSEFIIAEGRMFGDPSIKPNVRVKIENLGTRFSGEYLVTGAKHIFGEGSGYEVEFTVEGLSPQTLHSLLVSSDQRGQVWPGIYPALVTNTKDPDKLGRIKVKFPWLSDTLESDWAPLVAADAGNLRGMLIVPEVNDEVMVSFEHGNINYPYVIGGVWNGRDKPPLNDVVDANGKTVKRIWKTRTGHTLLFNESDSVSDITITEGKKSYFVKLDGQNQKIEVSDGTRNKITIDLTGSKKITIETEGDLEMKGKNINITAQQNVNVKASAGATIEGATATVKASGTTEIKGATVKIN